MTNCGPWHHAMAFCAKEHSFVQSWISLSSKGIDNHSFKIRTDGPTLHSRAHVFKSKTNACVTLLCCCRWFGEACLQTEMLKIASVVSCTLLNTLPLTWVRRVRALARSLSKKRRSKKATEASMRKHHIRATNLVCNEGKK